MKPQIKHLRSLVKKSKSVSTIQAVLAPKISIENVRTNLVSGLLWTAPASRPVSVTLDSVSRTVVSSPGAKPAYLVASGTDRDFVELSKDSGIPVAPFNGIKINAKIRSLKGARPKIVIAEFNEKRQRIGELTLGADVKVKAEFLKDTCYILPTIRVAEESEVVVEWFVLLGEEQQLRLGADRTIAWTNSSPASDDGGLDGMRKEIGGAVDALDRLRTQLSETRFETTLSNPGDADAEALAEARELTLRGTLTELASALPVSNGSHHYRAIPLTVAIVTDEYMYNFYKDVFDKTLYLSPDSWKETLSSNSVDLFLYVTAWKGLQSEEWKGIKFREKPKSAFEGIIDYCDERQIPTIFQSIEDPSNFEYFLPIAQKFGYVFTSDSDSIGNYRSELGHDRVFYGEYGANPLVNNPIGSMRTNFNRGIFAGSYPERYPERCKDMETVFDSIPDRDNRLLILDRNYLAEGFEYPERFNRSIIGPVRHDVLQKMHKLYRYSFNFNSIKSSPTMCAMRVYELQAQGKSIISNYARSVFNRFPNIRIIAHPTHLQELSGSAGLSPLEEQILANESLADVLVNTNGFEVAGRMVAKAGLPGPDARSSRILVVVGSKAKDTEVQLRGSQFVEYDCVTESELSAAPELLKSYGYVTYMSADKSYSPVYLAEKLSAFIYTDSEFVTQQQAILSASPMVHEYCEDASDRSCTLVSTSHSDAFEFVLGRAPRIEGRGYCGSPVEIGGRELAAAVRNETLSEPILTVVVPVFNNGRFLLSKCLPSLKRNKCWSQLRVLLVDDGSTDATTCDTCQELSNLYENIDFFTFGDGGSGSASRPRNKGIEMSDTELVTFLDPDNEISPGGYDFLLNEFFEANAGDSVCDFVSGYQVKVGETTKITGKHASGRSKQIADPVNTFFNAGKFPVVSTQAAVIRRRMLVENEIAFVEGAAGQDTLYGWQVLASANNPTFVDQAFLTYYAERDDSVTNAVSASYFEKSLRLEEVQVPVLKSLGVFETYRDGQFRNFFKNWYLKKLELVPEQEKQSSAAFLEKIAELYKIDASSLRL